MRSGRRVRRRDREGDRKGRREGSNTQDKQDTRTTQRSILSCVFALITSMIWAQKERRWRTANNYNMKRKPRGLRVRVRISFLFMCIGNSWAGKTIFITLTARWAREERRVRRQRRIPLGANSVHRTYRKPTPLKANRTQSTTFPSVKNSHGENQECPKLKNRERQQD